MLDFDSHQSEHGTHHLQQVDSQSGEKQEVYIRLRDVQKLHETQRQQMLHREGVKTVS